MRDKSTWDNESELEFMSQALAQAEKAYALGEVPVGAVIVKGDSIISEGHNLTGSLKDPTAHAEVIAIRQASKMLGDWRLVDCTLYTTLEPCAMCAGALVLSRIHRLVFGAKDPKSGMVGSLENLVCDERLNHRMIVTSGILEERSAQLLRGYFRKRRSLSNSQ